MSPERMRNAPQNFVKTVGSTFAQSVQTLSLRLNPEEIRQRVYDYDAVPRATIFRNLIRKRK